MTNIEKIVISEVAPEVTNVAWLNPSTKELKFFGANGWTALKDEDSKQKQADWNQADSEAVDFIKNKPEINSPLELTVKTYFREEELEEEQYIWVLDHTEFVEANGRTPNLCDQIIVKFDQPRDLEGNQINEMGVLQVGDMDVVDLEHAAGPYPLTMWRAGLVSSGWSWSSLGMMPASMGASGAFTIHAHCWIPYEEEYYKTDMELGYGVYEPGTGWDLVWI